MGWTDRTCESWSSPSYPTGEAPSSHLYSTSSAVYATGAKILKIHNIGWTWQWTRASNKASWLQQSIVTKIKIRMRSKWYNRKTKMREIQDCKNKSLVSISISACISYVNHISNIFFCNYMIQRQGDKFAGPSESSSAALDIWKSKTPANDRKNL